MERSRGGWCVHGFGAVLDRPVHRAEPSPAGQAGDRTAGRGGRPSDWKEAHKTSHQQVGAHGEHVFAHMKTWRIPRDCRLKDDGVHHAVLDIARIHNLTLGGWVNAWQWTWQTNRSRGVDQDWTPALRSWTPCRDAGDRRHSGVGRIELVRCRGRYRPVVGVASEVAAIRGGPSVRQRLRTTATPYSDPSSRIRAQVIPSLNAE